MTHSIIPVRLPTCGGCRFSKLIQIGQIECWGLPPTPVVVGGRPNIQGSVDMQIELIRPRLASGQAGCALHQPKLEGLADELTLGAA